MSELGKRAKAVLQAVVEEFIATGEAVGSKTIAKRYGLDLSAATVRNVMSELEEVGLLAQPHTSSGRVPTGGGLRYFVDSLLHVRGLEAKERQEIATHLQMPVLEFDDLMKETSKVLSELSQHTAVVYTPRPEGTVFEHIEFVRLREGEILAVLVTKAGKIENKFFRIEQHLEPSHLERMSNYLNTILSGLTLDEVRNRLRQEILRLQGAAEPWQTQALAWGEQVVGTKSEPDVIAAGQSNLIDGQNDVEKTRSILRAIEEKRVLLSLLDRMAEAPGVKVFIGAETEVEPLEDMSVVIAPYGHHGKSIGTLGVIGPRHMDYAKVISLVDFTAYMLSDLLHRPPR